LENVKIENEVHFIGSPLVERNVVSLSTYLEYIERICNKYSDANIVYIPHRREQKLKIKKISEKLGIQTQEMDKTIEMFELHNECLPGNITSFFSTALFNLNKLLPKKVRVSFIRLKDVEILSGKKHIENVYKVLDKEMSEESL
jgi:hypothetical protein